MQSYIQIVMLFSHCYVMPLNVAIFMPRAPPMPPTMMVDLLSVIFEITYR